ncbi:bifunctional transcriptional activator/DNA repair enzyme AdaA [Lacimicrobium alkaliphilum]|uniref:methylated-DNA--[protein]-cysteine S-methyltransferase n=1 Tax=Lacimicrobium alkaliphilum TaxID=1526571 RepID=A0A0U3AB70_9ALTE|nr:methylated-DNA--[protein]-cysteine S-methyltransferase [Lacimicrobium alkaliphilum]ALS98254.1 cysteine methyltransferase [Lacimicrobium alkaliphilum]
MSKNNSKQRIMALADYIEQHAEKSLDLEHLASEAAVSPYHLQRTFRQLFGVSPKQFQNAIRVQRLKQSLRDGTAISQAIYEAGFGSVSRVYEQLDQNFGMTLTEYKAGADELDIHFALRQTKLGLLLMAATERGVCFVHFGQSASTLVLALHQEFPKARLLTTPEHSEPALDLWIDALEQYLAATGPRPELPLHLIGTAFQLSVWRFLSNLKNGETVSYADVARGIARPSAYRAAANACGANKVAVLIPCHRVLRGDGGMGGYRWGVERKQQLLDLEVNTVSP